MALYIMKEPRTHQKKISTTLIAVPASNAADNTSLSPEISF